MVFLARAQGATIYTISTNQRTFQPAANGVAVVVGSTLAPGGKMSRTVRVLAFIIGAIWFFPVSCTTGLFVAISLWSKFDERHIEKGEQPHPLFFVVWQPGEAGEPFGYASLKDLSRIKTSAPARSFIMEQLSGRIEGGKSTVIAYKVLSSGKSEQLIEVAYSDDTYDSVSRYRATRSEVTPTFSKIMQPGYMFMAFPIAVGLAAAIYAIGKWLRRRVARAKAEDDASSHVAPSK